LRLTNEKDFFAKHVPSSPYKDVLRVAHAPDFAPLEYLQERSYTHLHAASPQYWSDSKNLRSELYCPNPNQQKYGTVQGMVSCK
ncbi:hypothetical protein P3689_24215, partial [Vibrio parahaemolyticus]|nr:hypothetical protein [Vibrio parahaemolyticus]